MYTLDEQPIHVHQQSPQHLPQYPPSYSPQQLPHHSPEQSSRKPSPPPFSTQSQHLLNEPSSLLKEQPLTEAQEKQKRRRMKDAEAHRKHRKEFKKNDPVGYKEFNRRRNLAARSRKEISKANYTEERKTQLKIAHKAYQVSYRQRVKAKIGYSKPIEYRYQSLKKLVEQNKATPEQVNQFETQREKRRDTHIFLFTFVYSGRPPITSKKQAQPQKLEIDLNHPATEWDDGDAQQKHTITSHSPQQPIQRTPQQSPHRISQRSPQLVPQLTPQHSSQLSQQSPQISHQQSSQRSTIKPSLANAAEKKKRAKERNAELARKRLLRFKLNDPEGHKQYNREKYLKQKPRRQELKAQCSEEKKKKLKAMNDYYQLGYRQRMKAKTGFTKTADRRYSSLQVLVSQDKATPEQINHFEMEREKRRDALYGFGHVVVSYYLVIIGFQVSFAGDSEKQILSPTFESLSLPSQNSNKWEALLGVAEKESASFKAKRKRKRRRSETDSASSKKRYQNLKQKGGVEYEKMLERKRQNERQRKKKIALQQTEEEREQHRLSENQRNRKLYVKRKERTGYSSNKRKRLVWIRELIEEGKHTPEQLADLEEDQRKRRVKYQREKAKRILIGKQLGKASKGQI
ncbi:uncharacterized protein FA14DRAFT_152109 [Meira miltonrushii]|uniref:Uncharacterized protein n=1 Tax=Meira miltonrushii TaxID=1280837 RepID=A0A316VGG7_9BASI|nr:uncharacterized protein FA14DRAFT_152109 [Meira miltonrushii]PWN36682.1 hypothetical protein FA14DRAFT_152109 [Meira miltonrushii]